MRDISTRLLIGALVAAPTSHACAGEEPAHLPAPSLAVSYARAIQEADSQPNVPLRREAIEAEPAEIPSSRPEFGKAGHRSWFVGAGGGVGSNDVDIAANGFIGVEWFLADRFQLSMELSGWWFDQQEDAAAANLNVMFKYHFIQRRDYSVFVSAGAGVIGATEDVPRGGTPVNFSPRAGVGFTYRLNDRDVRLVGGVRWQHFSNARLAGADDNPGTDLIHAYLGVSFPF